MHSANDRPPRPRPMSAKPSGRPTSAKPNVTGRPSRRPQVDDNEDDDEDLVQDDDGDDDEDGEFGDAAELAGRREKEKLRFGIPIVKVAATRRAFRPTSAPMSRLRPQSAQEQRELDREHRERAAVSISYLKLAAEKKKRRELQFAQELVREENEYKKRISQKIDQANKMCAAVGSKRSFSLAPDRDGLHMVKVTDPASSDRVISVENFHILFIR